MTKQKDGSYHDPDLYYKLCKPFASLDAANDNLDKFYTEFRELRKKYQIPDVVLLVRVVCTDHQEDKELFVTMNCGDASLIYPMTVLSCEKQEENFAKIVK